MVFFEQNVIAYKLPIVKLIYDKLRLSLVLVFLKIFYIE